jgi:transketolase C-terminal domain/subunit
MARQLHHLRSVVGFAMVKSQVLSSRLLNVTADLTGVTQALETGGKMPALNLPPGTAETWDNSD